MFIRKLILGAIIFSSSVLLCQCTKSTKPAKPTHIAEIKNAVAAAQAGQFDKIDPQVMREVMKQYKQPALPPLTTTPASHHSTRVNPLPGSGCAQCQMKVAESQAPTVTAPVQAAALVASPGAQSQVAANPITPPQESVKSYVHPIEAEIPAVAQHDAA